MSETRPTFRFHLLGLAHLPARWEISTCAYTQKVLKLSRILGALGHHVTFYGGEDSEVQADEFVQVVSASDRRQCYGDYDWRSEFFRHDGQDAAHQTFNVNAIRAIRERRQPGDFLLCTMGTYQRPIADVDYGAHLWVVEPGIGYEGIFAPFRAFESYAWMHYMYGRTGQLDGGWYDAVIPNYFDPADFPVVERKSDYALYLGRLIQRKGVEIAAQVTRAAGLRLIVAGQGRLVNAAEALDLQQTHVEFVGSVGPRDRAALLGDAQMLFAPTYYVEPFGGVAVEAQMCGTPVITTDWGAFSETVLHGVTGYRCRTFDEFVWAARNVHRLRPADCRYWALANYSMERIQSMFHEFFSRIADLERQGWYELHSERTDLNWLRKYRPPDRESAGGS
jgi:glycosyltransferase involved in cell wall biosynthesis